MISIVTGPPGNGKSMLVQTESVEEFVFGDRDIVTSTPCRIEPWVTGDGRGMIGLRHYVRLKHPRRLVHDVPDAGDLVAPGIVAFGRLLIVEDENELGTLFLWRRDRDTGKWFKVRWNSVEEQFNQDDWKRGGPAFIVTDEAWKCYNSRRWKDTEKVVEFYGRQHRKFGDDWVIVSHSHKDLDVQLNRMCQQWRQCVNYGLRRFGVFRQPAVFEVKTFYEAPTTVSARSMHSKIVRLDPMVVQTYDTSAGVAVGGGRTADVGRKRRGIPFAWVLVVVLLGFLLLVSVPRVVGSFFARTMGRSNQPHVKSVAKSVVDPPRSSVLASPVSSVTSVASPSNVLVTMSWYLRRPVITRFAGPPAEITEVGLSDGRVFRDADGHLQFLCPEYCVVDGVTNWYRPIAVSVQGNGGDRALDVASAPQYVDSYGSQSSEFGSSVVVIPSHQVQFSRPTVRTVLSPGAYSQNY